MATASIAPQEFFCPLSHQLMTDPVMSVHGETFQREAILAWLLEMDNDYCPFTGKPMSCQDLIPNYTLRTRIQGWMKENGKWPEPKQEEDDDEVYIRKYGLVQMIG